jgi:hypothetical protein
MIGSAQASNGAFRRIAAVSVCFLLLYFAAGGSFLHQHKGGPDPVCHVCQSLHAPALAASWQALVSYPELTGWHSAKPLQLAALDEFCFLPSGRAPPLS